MNPLIITGYHETGEKDVDFAWIWHRNTTANYRGQIYVVETKSSRFPPFDDIIHIPTNYNLGHIGDLLNGTSRHVFCGWSASMLAGAMIAYNCGKDMVYKESDCLAFGPWMQTMYNELGSAGLIFGRKHQSEPWMPCSQSLFLVRHSYIPTFVSRYLALGTDNDVNNLPETKFQRLEEADWDNVKRLSFGYDRERPVNFRDPVFYLQKITTSEMQELIKRGLVS